MIRVYIKSYHYFRLYTVVSRSVAAATFQNYISLKEKKLQNNIPYFIWNK